MGLMDEIQQQKRSASFPTKWEELKTKLSPEDFADFVAAISNPHISQAAIRRVLHGRGINISSGKLSEMRSDSREV